MSWTILNKIYFAPSTQEHVILKVDQTCFCVITINTARFKPFAQKKKKNKKKHNCQPTPNCGSKVENFEVLVHRKCCSQSVKPKIQTGWTKLIKLWPPLLWMHQRVGTQLLSGIGSRTWGAFLYVTQTSFHRTRKCQCCPRCQDRISATQKKRFNNCHEVSSVMNVCLFFIVKISEERSSHTK